MNNFVSRRDILKLAAVQGLAALPAAPAEASQGLLGPPPGWIVGQMSGAAALTEALKQEGCDLVFGIPGAQENELWDTFKARHLPYHLVTHEFSAAAGADGYAAAPASPACSASFPDPASPTP